MKRFLLLIPLYFLTNFLSAQAYMKVVIDRGDTTDNCDNKIDIELINQTTGPYVVTWWDNHWSPSTGFHATDLCENTILSMEVIDMECRHLRSNMMIFPESIPQVYLDTVIAILPSSPGACDGYLSFHFKNVSPSYTRKFGNSGSGGTVLDSVFTNLCEDDYHYSIYGLGAQVLGEVQVCLRYAPVLPCAPFKDSLVIEPQSAPGACDAKVTYNTTGVAGGTPYYHSIYKPVGGGSVQVNSGTDTSFSYMGLCSGPHIIDTRSYPNNNYFVSNKIFIDNPVIADSIWGNAGSGQIDTIYLNALTNCGINYSYNVDSVYISNMTHIAGNQFEFEITVLQEDSTSIFDTILSYETAFVDTSHQLCFDLTFFCYDSSTLKTVNSEIHNYIYFPADESVVTKIEENKRQKNSLIIHPNPSSGVIRLNNLPIGKGDIKIFGIEGKLYYSSKYSSSSEKIDLSNLSNGIYIVQVEQGDIVLNQKLIIQNK